MTPGRKLSITTSARAASRKKAARPASDFKSSNTRSIPRCPLYA